MPRGRGRGRGRGRKKTKRVSTPPKQSEEAKKRKTALRTSPRPKPKPTDEVMHYLFAARFCGSFFCGFVSSIHHHTKQNNAKRKRKGKGKRKKENEKSLNTSKAKRRSKEAENGPEDLSTADALSIAGSFFRVLGKRDFCGFVSSTKKPSNYFFPLWVPFFSVVSYPFFPLWVFLKPAFLLF